MVSTPEGFTNNSTVSPMTPTPSKKPNARKKTVSFHQHIRCKKENYYLLSRSCHIKA